jgi:hypothetical protein
VANNQLNLGINVSTTGDQALNQLSDSLNKVVSIADKAGKSGQSFSSFPSEIKQFVQDQLGAAERTAISFASSFGAVGIGVASATSAFAGFLLVSESATRHLAEIGVQTEALSLKMGLTTKEVGQFSFAARAVGEDIGVFQTGMRKLSQGLADGGEEGKKAREALSELGVKTRSLNGDIRPTSDILEQVAAGLSKISEPARRNAEVLKIFGRAGIELIPVLAHLNENIARSKELGVGLSDAEVAKFLKYQQAIVEVDTAWARAKRHFEEGIAGTIWINVKGAGAKFLEGLSDARPDSTKKRGAMGAQSQDEFYNALIFGDSRGIAPPPSPSLPGLPPEFSGHLSLEGGSIGRDQASFARTLAGAQSALEKAKGDAAESRADYFGSSGQVTQDVADRKRAAWEKAEAAARKYEDQVKILTKAEGERIAGIEKASTLKKEGEGFFRFAGANGDVFVTKTEQQSEIGKIPKPKNLRKPGEYNPEEDAFRLGLQDPMKEGVQFSGDFVSPEASRPDGRQSFGPFDDPQYKQNEQIHLDGLRSELDYTSQIIQLRTGPGGEVAAALRINDLRLTAAEKEFETTNDIVALENTRTKLAYERGEIAEQEFARQKAQFREFSGGLLDSLFGGGAGVSKFIEGAVKGLARTVFQNAATEFAYPELKKLIPKAGDANSTIGRLLAGTPFGADPTLKTAGVTLTTAGTSLQEAADKLLAVGGVAGSGTSGGGYLSSLPGLGGIFSGVSKNNPFVFNAEDGTIGANPGFSPGVPYVPFDPNGPGSGAPFAGGVTSKGAGYGGKALGVAAAAAGGFAAFHDFKTGGVKNDVAGVGALLGSAAAITALIPGGQIVALGLGIASAATSLISSLLPDPKKVREDAITKEIERNKYLAPTALNISQDGSGNYTDTDRKGGLRQSPFSAVPSVAQSYTWWKGNTPYDVPGGVTSPFTPQTPIIQHIYQAGAIQTMDAGSFHEFAKKNSGAIGDATADHLQNTEGRLHAALRYAAS